MARALRKSASAPDPTIYPETDHMGESLLHRELADTLRFLLVALFALRRVKARVGANQFIYYRQHAPTTSVAPDVYVLPGVEPDALFPSWKTWETGIAPSFALEVVSDDWEKEYRDSPLRYAELGASEVVIFDPSPGTHPDRIRWQVYRRDRRGELVLAERSAADAVRAKTLGCWLRVVGEGTSMRIRVGLGLRGHELLPTAEERAAEASAQASEAAARASEASARASEASARASEASARASEANARAEEEIARREEAERELERLRAQLARAPKKKR